MINQILHIFAMRLIAIEGTNRQSIISVLILGLELLKNTRCALKRCRVSFFSLTIPSPYRWLVKHLAQLQETLVGSDRCPYWDGRTLLGTFSFSFLLGVFFSLSFKITNPLRNNIQRVSGNHDSNVGHKGELLNSQPCVLPLI